MASAANLAGGVAMDGLSRAQRDRDLPAPLWGRRSSGFAQRGRRGIVTVLAGASAASTNSTATTSAAAPSAAAAPLASVAASSSSAAATVSPGSVVPEAVKLRPRSGTGAEVTASWDDASRRQLRSRSRSRSHRWSDPGASQALRWLRAASRPRSPGERRAVAPLPACLYDAAIAPFLRFDKPLPDQIYAVGGRKGDEVLNTVEMFDTWHGRWTACPAMAARRCGCAAAALPNGSLMVVGGYDERGIIEGLLGSCEVFSPATQHWSMAAASLKRPRWGHACGLLAGRVYAVGGCSLRVGAPPHEAFMETLACCEVYDPSAAPESAWSPCADLCVARSGARVVACGSRHLAVVGGCDDVFGRSEVLSSIELFDPVSNRWELLEPLLRVPRSTAAVAALDDSRILVVGGTPALASAEVYHVPTCCLGEGCCRSCSAAVGGSSSGSGGDGGVSAWRAAPLSVGGNGGGNGQCHLVGGGSSPCPPIAEGRMGCHAVALRLPAPGKAFPLCTDLCVVVVGGENSGEFSDEDWHDGGNVGRQLGGVLVFDVAKGEWRPAGSFPPMPTPRTAAALCLSPGMVAGHS